MAGAAGRLLWYGAWMDRKWPVAPESAMAVEDAVGGGEEPKLGGDGV